MRSDHDRVRLCMVLGGHWAAQMGGAQFQAKCILDVLAEDARFETSYLARVVPAQRDWDSYRIVSFGEGLPGRAIGTLLQLPSLYLALRRQRPQVVYQRCLMPYTGMCALYCAINGARFVFHVASDGDVHREPLTRWSPGGLLRALSRRISEFGMRHADAIVVQTEHQARILKAQYGLTATIVVPNFHPAAAHRSEVGSRPRLRILWVANIKPIKNPEMYVELAAAFAGAADSPEFVIIGRSGDSERYRPLHERIAALPNMTYLGELPVERVNEEIARSDLVVNTSFAEGFPNTFIQAWLRGVPVLSWRVDPDACLSRAGAGLVAADVDEMVATIRSLDASRERLCELSAKALQYGVERHTTAPGEALIGLFRGLAAGADSAGSAVST
ncbi:MAG: glycosyltransferase family 4 protein [Steroidobacteraceae bacterium]